MVLLAFVLQVIAAIAAFALAPRIARGGKGMWVGACVGALVVLLAWPLMRVFPIACVDALGAPFLACVELAIPAVLLFGVAAPHLPKRSDQTSAAVAHGDCGVVLRQGGVVDDPARGRRAGSWRDEH